MGNNLTFTCMRHILAGKHVTEVVHRSRFGDTCRWTHGSMQSQCFSMREEIPQNCPLPCVDPDPPCNTWLLGPTAPDKPNAISIEPAVSSRLTLHYLYTLLWGGPFPTPKLPLPMGISRPSSNTWWLTLTPPRCQTASRSVQPFLQDT